MINKVIVIGLGYVGLPLALAAAKSGYVVVGLDISADKVSAINNGNSPVEDVDVTDLQELLSSQKFRASSDYSEISGANIVIICVPTPLVKNKLPDLSNLESAAKSLSAYLTQSTLVILESTVAPGTTRDFLFPLTKSNQHDLKVGLEIAFSPERIDPSNKNWNLKNTPKIVAGLTENSKKKAVEFYSKFVDNIIECDSVEIAETSKLLENSFRLINVSFINELSKMCHKLGIDITKVIDAASTKPYGFMPFYPSIGVGGHCIPVDPIYLSSKATDVGEPILLINLAYQINLTIHQHFIKRAEEQLGMLKTKKILVVGVSYKPNVADVRETPVEALIFGLKQTGALVSWHDDLVKEWNGEKSVPLSNDFDLAIIATPHDNINLSLLGNVPILNTRGSI